MPNIKIELYNPLTILQLQNKMVNNSQKIIFLCKYFIITKEVYIFAFGKNRKKNGIIRFI